MSRGCAVEERDRRPRGGSDESRGGCGVRRRGERTRDGVCFFLPRDQEQDSLGRVQLRDRGRDTVYVGTRHRSRPSPELVERGIVREQRCGMPVRADPEERQVEDDVPELDVVRVRGFRWGELAEHAMFHQRPTVETVEEALADEPVVRALVVGGHAALVGPPDLDAAPVRREPRRALVGRPRSRSAGERDVPAATSRLGQQVAGLAHRLGSARRDPQLDVHLVPLQAIHACLWPPITRRQSRPSSSPRLTSLGSSECALWLGARDPETGQHYLKRHYSPPAASSRPRSIAAWIAFRKAARTPACSSSRIARIVVPPGEVTISRSSTGCIFSSRRSLAVPNIVCTTSSVVSSRDRPRRMPASIIDSARSAKYAGPEPETAVTASMYRSGTRTTRPMWSSTSSARARCSSLAWAPAHSPATPSCTVAGVFGIARRTGTPGATRSSIADVGTAAAIESTVWSVDRIPPISPSSGSKSCGLTAMTTIPAPATASVFEVVTRMPSRSESSFARSSRRTVATISSGFRHSVLSSPARSASPIFPAPRIAMRRGSAINPV